MQVDEPNPRSISHPWTIPSRDAERSVADLVLALDCFEVRHERQRSVVASDWQTTGTIPSSVNSLLRVTSPPDCHRGAVASVARISRAVWSRRTTRRSAAVLAQEGEAVARDLGNRVPSTVQCPSHFPSLNSMQFSRSR